MAPPRVQRSRKWRRSLHVPSPGAALPKKSRVSSYFPFSNISYGLKVRAFRGTSSRSFSHPTPKKLLLGYMNVNGLDDVSADFVERTLEK